MPYPTVPAIMIASVGPSRSDAVVTTL